MRHMLQAANSGFTIPELLIVMSVSAIAMALLFGPLNDLFKDNTVGLQSIIQTADTRGALRQIERRVTASDSFLATNNITDRSTSNNSTYTWNWQGSGTASRVLITENYGTDLANDTNDGAGNIVLTSPTCDITAPQTINYVYYVKNSALYRKTITQLSYPPTCGGTVQQKRSCATTVTNPAYCQINDAWIVGDVSNFSVDYYSSPSTSTPLDSNNGTPPHTKYSAGTSSSVPGTASTIVISLTLTRGSGTNTVTTTSQMRLTKINGN